MASVLERITDQFTTLLLLLFRGCPVQLGRFRLQHRRPVFRFHLSLRRRRFIGWRNSYRDRQLAGCVALEHTTRRRNVGVIAAYRGPHVSLVGANVIGWIKTDRASGGRNPDRQRRQRGLRGDACERRSRRAREPQLALREGAAAGPAPGRGRRRATPSAAAALDPERTVLITGGTGGLGALIARHLVERPRRPPPAAGQPPRPRGARAPRSCARSWRSSAPRSTIAACDVSDRAQLEAAARLDPRRAPARRRRPLPPASSTTASSSRSTPSASQRVLAPKADAAWHLHELTAGARALRTSSSSPRSPARSAAPARATTPPPTPSSTPSPSSASAEGPAGHLDRLGRSGSSESEHDRPSCGEADLRPARAAAASLPIAAEQGLELFDARPRRRRGRSPSPAPLDRAALRAAGRGRRRCRRSSRGLVRARAAAPPRGRLARPRASPPCRRPSARRCVLELVREHAAAVLGHASRRGDRPRRAPSRTSASTRSARSSCATGSARRPACACRRPLVFDYPTAAALAAHLLERGRGRAAAGGVAVQAASASEEPIAIVGMAAATPAASLARRSSGSCSPRARDAIAAFPADRGWDLERLYDPDPDQPGTSYAREGGFLADAGRLRRRLLRHQPARGAGDGPPAAAAAGSRLGGAGGRRHRPAPRCAAAATGVFAGVMYHDYGRRRRAPAELEGYLATGAAGSVVSGRVAYALGLEGPAMTVDTACSSSLVAMHLAAQALRGGECDLALAGGVTVLADARRLHRVLAASAASPPTGAASPSPRRPTAPASSEGVGLLVLERLSDAERNGHRGPGHDPRLGGQPGRRLQRPHRPQRPLPGAGDPPGPGQRRPRARATSTRSRPTAPAPPSATRSRPAPCSPPTARSARQPLRLGSIKSNIGHTQAAAGVAGVIKMVLALREGVLPKTLHVDAPSSQGRLGGGRGRAADRGRAPGSRTGSPRRAGVSSFGITGTNAHLILEEAPVAGRDPGPGASAEDRDGRAPSPGPIPFVLSAKARRRLREQAARLAAHLEDNPELDLDRRRLLPRHHQGRSFEHRAVVVGDEREELLGGLDALAAGRAPRRALAAKAAPAGTPRLPLHRPGLPAPGHGQGAATRPSPPSPRPSIEACAELDPHLDRSLEELLFAEAGSKEAELLDRTDLRPARPLRHRGRPRPPLREPAASSPTACSATRSGRSPPPTSPASLASHDAAQADRRPRRADGRAARGRGDGWRSRPPRQEAAGAIDGQEAELSLAAINGPAPVVVSGEPRRRSTQLRGALAGAGRKTKRLASPTPSTRR